MNKLIEDNTECIAVIAGSGVFSSLLISHLQKTKRNFVVLCLKKNTPPEIVKDTKHIFVELGEIGKVLTFFKEHHVKQIVFVGKIQRPSFSSMRFDKKGLSFLAKLGMNFLKGGDDQILSSVIKLLEIQGFEIISPQELISDLVTPLGVLGKIKPNKQDYEDISLSKKVLTALGALDVGQAIIVENGYVLGIEAAEGTDNLILRCSELRKEKKRSGVLVKMKKIAQETRIDLPAIGVETIINAYKSGLKGVAVETGNSLIIDIDSVIRKANELKLFLVGID